MNEQPLNNEPEILSQRRHHTAKVPGLSARCGDESGLCTVEILLADAGTFWKKESLGTNGSMKQHQRVCL